MRLYNRLVPGWSAYRWILITVTVIFASLGVVVLGFILLVVKLSFLIPYCVGLMLLGGWIIVVCSSQDQTGDSGRLHLLPGGGRGLQGRSGAGGPEHRRGAARTGTTVAVQRSLAAGAKRRAGLPRTAGVSGASC